MTIIYRVTDRIKVKVGDMEFKLSPLSLSQKNELQTIAFKGQQTGNQADILEAASKAIKYCVKEVSGIYDTGGNEYKMDFDDSGCLSDECVDDLLNLECGLAVMNMCAAMSRSTPEEFTNPDGTKMEGVKRVHTEKPTKKKKSSKGPN